MQQSLLHQPSKLFCVFRVFRGNILFSHRIHGIHRIDWQRVSSHRIHGIHRIDWQRCSPTDFTEFTESTGRDVLPQNSRNSQNRLAEGVLPQNSRNSQNRLAEGVLPQISQILTDVVFLEFCEFCVFCGTSHAPVNLCKSVQSVGELFSTLLQNRLAEDVLPQISQILTDGVCLDFCEFREFCGTSHAPSESVKICAICGRIILAAWVWQGCHTLLQCHEGRGVHAAQQVAVEQCAGGAELVDIAVGGVGAGIRCVHVGGAGRYVQRVG